MDSKEFEPGRTGIDSHHEKDGIDRESEESPKQDELQIAPIRHDFPPVHLGFNEIGLENQIERRAEQLAAHQSKQQRRGQSNPERSENDWMHVNKRFLAQQVQ